MDRVTLLNNILEHLDEVIQLMDEAVDKPDDEDKIWSMITDVHGLAEAQLDAARTVVIDHQPQAED